MQRAFTLAEISTVIVVIGVTGALAASSMADQVKDARAGASVGSTAGDIREEYRQAREQLKGLRFRSASETTPNGSRSPGVIVERVASCASGTLEGQRTVGGDEGGASTLAIAPSEFCINPDGSVLVPESAAQSPAASEPLVMIRSEMSGGRASLSVLRLDPVGFSDLGSRQDTVAGIRALIDGLKSDGAAAMAGTQGSSDGTDEIVNRSVPASNGVVSTQPGEEGLAEGEVESECEDGQPCVRELRP
jgi:prepilin-type N-terminal cleavage/methylation domain-containing protein